MAIPATLEGDQIISNIPVGNLLLICVLIHYVFNKYLASKVEGNVLKNGFKIGLFALRLYCALALLDGLIGTLVLPATFAVSKNDTIAKNWEELKIPVSLNDGSVIHLSGGTFIPSAQQANGPVILFLLPNGVGFEKVCSYLETYARDAQARRIVTINYRGVGKSEGWPRKSDDLVQDGVATVHYILKNFDNVKEKDIIAHGWSIGGAVALSLRQHFPEIMVVSDRSFRNLGSAGLSMLGDMMVAASVGIAAGFIISFVLSENLEMLRVRAGIMCGVIAAIFAMGGLSLILHQVLDLFQWEFGSPSERVLYSAPLCIVYHREDRMIDYDISSLHKVINTDHEMIYEMELTKRFHNPAAYHMYMLSAHEDEWGSFIQILDSMKIAHST